MMIVLKMDRPVISEGDNPHYIVPGGYNIGGIDFDFVYYDQENDNDDNSIIYCDVNLLDTYYSPVSVNITLDFIKNNKFKEFFIYTGEKGCDPEINPVKVISLWIEDDNNNRIEADEKILNNINEVLCN